jgi:glycosyltransferase involved in cell wall biosynthesis
MKILLISHFFKPGIGGIETISEQMANMFSEEGHEVTVITTTPNSELDTFNFKVIRNPSLTALLKLHFTTDFVFENNPTYGLSWPKFFTIIPSLVVLQTLIQRINYKVSIKDKIKQWLLLRNKFIVSISKFVQDHITLSSIIIPNPYNDQVFKKWDYDRKSYSFVFLGRLVSDKGADMAVDAISRLKKKYPDICLAVIGRGNEWESLHKQVSDNESSDYISFLGALVGEELVTELNKHSYILIPSRWKEPFGIVALEGIACGCIPIVSDEGGLPGAVGKAGLVFKRNDTTDLVRVIDEILQDQNKQNILIANQISHLEKHTLKHISKEFLKLMENKK